MPTIALFETPYNPEHATAVRMLLVEREPVGKIWRVYSAGDPRAELDRNGVPRETVLYLRFRSQSDMIGEPWTATLRDDGELDRRCGWGLPAGASDPA